jgi:FkbM family methyltransferase
MLLRAGVSPLSILLYPLRRRLPRARTQLDLRGGASITAPKSEPLIFLFREIWVERCYEPEDLPLGPQDTVVDIGAHVGLFALRTATRAPGTRIIAVEPSPVAAAHLRRNVAASRRREVIVVEAACGAEPGRARLFSVGAQMMNTLYPGGQRAPRDGGVEVEVLTLDEIFARHDVRTCALLKLDCEGAEYGILLGASEETLARVRDIVLEYHVGLQGHRPEELVERLRASGFAVRTVPSPTDPIHGYLYATRRQVHPGTGAPAAGAVRGS